MWHLLETKHCVGDTDSHVSCLIWMPTYLSNCPLDLVWILEDHNSFSGYSLREVLWLFSVEVLLKQINLIVLSDALLSSSHEVLSCLCEPLGWVSVQFFEILLNITWLSVVVFLRPPYLIM